MPNNIALIALGVFCFLFGLLTVTNIQIEWSKPLMGFAALVAGVICLIVGIMNVSTNRGP